MVTVTLFRYLESELINEGENEDYNKNQLTMYDQKYRFLPRISRYGDDDEILDEILTNRIFRGMRLDDIKLDFEFKRMFVNKFMHYQIDTETIDLFASKVTYTFLSMKGIIENTIKNMTHFSTGSSVSNTTHDDDTKNKYRTAFADLPQDQVNLDLDNNTMDYANNNTVSNTGIEVHNKHNTTQQNYNPETHEKALLAMDKIFVVFKKNCFLRVFG